MCGLVQLDDARPSCLYNLYCFGIVNEGANSHRHYLYGEELVGKGLHEVVSLLDKYLDENTPLTARTITLYADNCGGQNKNNLMLFYLLWLVDTRRHDTIKLKFQIKGHTRNSCDRGFGTFRNVFIRNSYYSAAEVADSMSTIGNILESLSLSPLFATGKSCRTTIKH